MAAAQFCAQATVPENTAEIIRLIKEAGAHSPKVDVVCFHEAATTGYFPDLIRATKREEIAQSLSDILGACKECGVAAVVDAMVVASAVRHRNGGAWPQLFRDAAQPPQRAATRPSRAAR